jgi:hypothetical protein
VFYGRIEGYAVTQEQEADSLADRVRGFAFVVKGRRILTVGSFLVMLPAATLTLWITESETAGIVMAGACMLASWAGWVSLAVMQCPKCRRPIFSNEHVSRQAIFWLNRCRDCGLDFSEWERRQ